MTEPRPLTEKQQAFVREYLIDFNGTAAVRRAGYSPNGASQTALILLRNTEIQAALNAGVARIEEKAEFDAAWVVRQAAEIVRRAVDENDASWKKAAVPALALLAKRLPEFREAGVNVNVSGDKVLILRERGSDGSPGS